MKTIGLLGGMSWESTAVYYRIINREVRDRLGALRSARVALYSVDFEEIERLQHLGEWAEAGRVLGEAARRVEAAGADFLVICTNTMHKVVPEIQRAIGIPVLHIADATATAIQAAGLDRVGLLGTRFTMEQEFYRGRIVDRYGMDVLIPSEPERAAIHRVIFDELCAGRIRKSSRAEFTAIIERLVARGAQGVVLGCTEISLLVGPDDSPVPVFDTTAIHARAAVEWAMEKEST